MAFQTGDANVREFLAGGLEGEIARETTHRVSPREIDSSIVVGLANPFGYAYTNNPDGTVRVGGSNSFAGILCFPKEFVLRGDDTGNLNPVYSLPNFVTGELLTHGIFFGRAPNLGAIGDEISYFDTTGELRFGPPPGGFTLIPRAELLNDVLATDDLAIIQLT